ncbi:MAG: ubiquinol-cytochrome C chaperone family protein [Rickettsiales bacterium]
MFQKLAQFFSPDPLKAQAQDVYIACVSQARNPFFYTDLNVPDTIDGRFDMVVLHLFIVLRALKGEIAFGEAITDAFFADMDRNLREMGVGDPSVGKRIRKMVDALYGRIAAYETAWADDATLREAFARNIYASVADNEDLQQLLGYIRRSDAQIQQAAASLRAGNVTWPSPSGL